MKGSMILYLLSDVKEFAERKYGNLEEEQEKRRIKKLRRHEKKNQGIKDRRDELEKELSKQGLKIRNDSKLCSGYIHGTLKNWSLNEVVDMMGEMRWLFEYTPYQKELDMAVKDGAENHHYGGGWYWGEAYRIAYEEEEPSVRFNILRRYPKPEKWPWLPQKPKLNLRFRK